ncbi:MULTISPECIES: BON domain-containing protein [Gimesia]|jgi:hypothetical protein|uniref:BON domain-containing protein n=1 Tax=Gimesia chilikensis TaxID=2605989 RepID=A0A517PI60_9PLAN|nr:BON domain-containing protein [Gimesia chilikensis]MBN68792.1 hypothetical protein [Gimesia sp.]MCR9231077.1 BON domain-containing protein [bacterium]KAA0137402.1 hypothetical protein FYZ48_15625 [Gimesia chilikensis]QDT19039.1 hypothetical protein HG66A1_08030 [Gimesia chilikensis]QDT83152.1 hypothetical protein MalM14_07830 [Gimesia chilikensis]
MTVETYSQKARKLSEKIEQTIALRTGSQVQSLKVDILGEIVVLSGRTDSFYHKQLATHAALSEIDQYALTNNIRVES